MNNLDPQPWVTPSGKDRAGNRPAFGNWDFSPRDGYSQNLSDYES